MTTVKGDGWRGVGGFSFLLGAMLVLYVGSLAWQRQVSQRLAQAELAQTALETQVDETHVAEADSLAEIRVATDEPSEPQGRPERGSVIGRIVVPAAGVDVVAFEGVDRKTLDRGAGHFPGTALPGRPGNSAFAAHRDVEFRGLRRVEPGHDVFIDTGQATFVYRIEETRVAEPSEVEVLDPSGGSDLTLITCYPFDWVGPAPRRFVVSARLRGRFEPEDNILGDVLGAAAGR